MSDQQQDATSRHGSDPHATLLPDGEVGTPRMVTLEPGSKVSRYTVIERVGAGAMGIVFSAWDPKLDRRVALKVVQGDGYRAADTMGRFREAKALAKLSHPGVVTIYDVGTVGDALFIAMEYLRGVTLAQWRAEHQGASWSDVVQLYVHAGAGLAAAHDAGLVHRDFKPANVMVTDGGGVKVLDFGLARMDGDGGATPRAGTPRYMAPEQHGGGAIDARCDQFSFCASLYEALFRQHPFEGDTAFEISLGIQAGALRRLPTDHDVPARVSAAIQRGLSSEAADRFESMDDLLGQLDPLAPSRRRQWSALAVAGTLIVGAAAVVASGGQQPCTQASAPADEVWNAEVRTQLERALRDEPALAPAFAAQVVARHDTFAQGWAAARQDACQATKIRQTQTEATMELRYHCLDTRLDTVASGLGKLLDPRPGAPRHANAAAIVEDIPALDRCSDLETLRAEYPPPEDPKIRARVRQLDVAVSAGHELRSRDVEQAEKDLRAILIEADQLDYAPLRVHVRQVLGSLLSFTGKVQRGTEMIEEGVVLGLRANARAATVGALYELARQKGTRGRNAPDALFLVGVATAIAETFPGGELAVDQRLAVRMEIFERARRPEEAFAEGKRLLERIREAGDLDAPRGIEMRAHMAKLLLGLERFDEADAILTELLERSPPEGGRPELARAYVHRAQLRQHRDDTEGAVADQLQAYEHYKAVLGPGHLNAAGRLGDIALILGYADRPDESRDYSRRAIADLLAGHDGHPDPSLAQIYENLGWAQLNLGDLEAAVEAFDQADRWTASLRGTTTAARNWRDQARGRIAEERGQFDAAGEIFSSASKTADTDAYRLACEVGRNIAKLRAEDTPEAREALESAIDNSETNSGDKARAAWGLAMAEARREQPQTARRHIARAREHLAEVPYARMTARKLDALERKLDSAAAPAKDRKSKEE